MRFDPCKIAPLGAAGACEIASPQSDTYETLTPHLHGFRLTALVGVGWVLDLPLHAGADYCSGAAIHATRADISRRSIAGE